MFYETDRDRQLESIVSVQMYIQNSDGLSDDALVDEAAEIMYDVEDEEIADLVAMYHMNGKITRKQRDLLKLYYILFHSLPYAEELC